MKYLVLFLLFTQNVLAASGVGLGIFTDGPDNLAVLIGDTNLFDHKSITFDFHRYGGGGARLQVGNHIGFHAHGNSGFYIFGLDSEDKNTVAPLIGFEVLNGEISFNSSTTIQDYYHGFLGASLGVQADIEGCRILPLIRGGGTMGTLGKNGMLPEFDLAYGPGMHVSCDPVYASYGLLRNFFSGKYVHSVDVIIEILKDKYLGLHMENVRGIKDETSSYLFMKGIL